MCTDGTQQAAVLTRQDAADTTGQGIFSVPETSLRLSVVPFAHSVGVGTCSGYGAAVNTCAISVKTLKFAAAYWDLLCTARRLGGSALAHWPMHPAGGALQIWLARAPRAQRRIISHHQVARILHFSRTIRLRRP